MPSRIDIGPEGGPFVAINENSNDLELQDINGNVIAVWDETEGQWDLNNNSLTNINAIDASSATLDDATANTLEADSAKIDGGISNDVDNPTIFRSVGSAQGIITYAINKTITADNSAQR